MATYLVTGGAGFIGSHIVEALVAAGERVRVLDDLSTGRRANIEPFESSITFVQGDVRRVDDVDGAVSGADYVIHQAALASVPRSIEDPVGTSEVNANGTLNLLDAARRNSVKAFVFASSSSVYGDSEVLPKVETMLPQPKSPYAASKLSAEYYCRVFGEVYGLRTVGLRYFNVFGPRQDPGSQYAAVIPIFTSALLRGEAPTIFGDGEQSRDFTYVSNVVTANLMACTSNVAPGSVYNIACGDRFTLNDLYSRLQSMVGADIAPEYAAPRTGDVKHSQADVSDAVRQLGYETGVAFDEGLRRTVEWYKRTISAT